MLVHVVLACCFEYPNVCDVRRSETELPRLMYDDDGCSCHVLACCCVVLC